MIGPERQLCRWNPRPVQEIVGELHVATRLFRHTHLKADLLRILHLAQELQLQGYTLIWQPRTGVVGAHKQTKAELLQQPATKEVTRGFAKLVNQLNC